MGVAWKYYCWKEFDFLSDERFEHLRVNHSVNFKDANTGAHTKSIEGMWSLWNHTKHAKDLFSYYLAKYMWRRLHGNSFDDETFTAFLKMVVTLYLCSEKLRSSKESALFCHFN